MFKSGTICELKITRHFLNNKLPLNKTVMYYMYSFQIDIYLIDEIHLRISNEIIHLRFY